MFPQHIHFISSNVKPGKEAVKGRKKKGVALEGGFSEEIPEYSELPLRPVPGDSLE